MPKQSRVYYYTREELQGEVKAFLSEHEKKHRKWYCLFTLVLLIILAVMFYVGLSFRKWNEIWSMKEQRDRRAMEQYLKDREVWLNDSVATKNGKR